MNIFSHESVVCRLGGWCRQWILKWLRWRDVVTNAALNRSHISRGEFVPCVFESIFKGCLVPSKFIDKITVGRFSCEGNVGRQHHDLLGASLWAWRCSSRCSLGNTPLILATRTRVNLPLVLRQFFEVNIVPRHRVNGPGAFEATGATQSAGK